MLRGVLAMSKLTELLDELCPDGVEFRTLKEVCKEIIVPQRDRPKVFGGEIPWCRIEDIEGQLITGSKLGLGVTKDTIEGMNLRVCPEGTVLATCSASLGVVAIAAQPLVTNQTFIGLVCGEDLLNKYLYYFLFTQERKMKSIASTGTIPYISRKKFERLCVPVPPLEVQQEIVRVLDAFTNLEQSLVSELELRKKQFDSVRRSVISDSQAAEKKVLRLREAESEGIVTLGRGKVISKKDIAANPGDYPVYSSSGAGNGEFGRYGNYMFDDERISWSVDGGGRLFYRPAHRYSVTNVSGWMTVNISDLQVKYLYYVLLSQWENESFDYTRKAHPSVIREVYAFSIPTIEIQDEVVSKLDSLESLIQSIEQEISLRRKQYEFYRNELLSFASKED